VAGLFVDNMGAGALVASWADVEPQAIKLPAASAVKIKALVNFIGSRT
jgi:hypothetical protein